MDEATKKYIESLPKADAPPVGTTAVDSSTLGFDLYSRTDYIVRSQGKIIVNWVRSFSGACIESFPNNSIEEAAVLDMKDDGVCANGKGVTYAKVK